MEVTETFAGISLPGHLHTQESLSFAATFPFRPTDVVIATYPKSGEGWRDGGLGGRGGTQQGWGTAKGTQVGGGSVGQGWGPPRMEGGGGGHGQALPHSPQLAGRTGSCLRGWE